MNGTNHAAWVHSCNMFLQTVINRKTTQCWRLVLEQVTLPSNKFGNVYENLNGITVVTGNQLHCTWHVTNIRDRRVTTVNTGHQCHHSTPRSLRGTTVHPVNETMKRAPRQLRGSTTVTTWHHGPQWNNKTNHILKKATMWDSRSHCYKDLCESWDQRYEFSTAETANHIEGRASDFSKLLATQPLGVSYGCFFMGITSTAGTTVLSWNMGIPWNHGTVHTIGITSKRCDTRIVDSCK